VSPRRSPGIWYYICALASSLLLLPAPTFHAAPQGSGYRVIRTIPLNADGAYDYVTVDPDARRVYVPRNTHIQIIDADSGKLIGDIPDLSGHPPAVGPPLQ
jgi:hypothetical protein